VYSIDVTLSCKSYPYSTYKYLTATRS